MPRTRRRITLAVACVLVAAIVLSSTGLASAAMTFFWQPTVDLPDDTGYWDSSGNQVIVEVRGRLNDVDMVNGTTGWAVGYVTGSSPTPNPVVPGPRAMIAACSGGVWNDEILTSHNVELRGVAAPDATNVWAVGDGGVILKRGATDTEWNAQISGTTASLRAVAFGDATHGWAIGGGGTVLQTTNGTAWSAASVDSGVSTLNDVFALDSTRAWAVGDGGVALYRDAGGVWRKGTVPAGTGVLRSVHFVDASLGWAVGDGRTILRTVNGGGSWTAQTAPPSPRDATDSPKSVVFYDANRGIAVGDHEAIWRTENGGTTWVIFHPAPTNEHTPAHNLVACANTNGDATYPNDVIIISIPDRTINPLSPPADKSVIFRARLLYSAPPAVPSAPTGLTFAPLGATKGAHLTWTDNSNNETAFAIERSQNSPTGTFTEIATVGSNVTAYDDTSGALDWTSSWYYRVRARNTGGTSSPTSVQGGKLDITAPTVWSNATTAPYPGSASITISASDLQSGVTNIVYRLNGGADQPGPVANLGPGVYSFDYRARDAAGNWSAYSTPITVTVVAPATLSGTVTSGGSPLAGATVNVGGTWSATTGAGGTYTVPNIAPGTYVVSFSKAGYDTVTQNGVAFIEGATLTRDVSLTANATVATLSGTVTSGGSPLQGVTARVNDVWVATTVANGTYAVTGITAPGTYSVTYSKTGYVSQTLTGVAFSSGGTTTRDVSMVAVPVTPLSPVYRFYNNRTGTHFYTADAGERDRVIATLGHIFSYEGPAYFVVGTPSGSTQSVYRFYNNRAGVHFYTASETERNNVIATLSWLYTYEGPAFNVPTQ